MKEKGRYDLKAAVIGLGKMGVLHACILNTIPSVKLVGICEKSALMRRIAERTLRRVHVVDEVGKLADLEPDLVYITTPIPSHFSIAKMVYSERISSNLFVEKTLATSSSQARELCTLADNYDGSNMVGYMKRFSVTFEKAKKILEENVLGEELSFRAYAYSSDFADAKRGSKMSGFRGGVLGDLGSHVIDLALWFFGDLRVESSVIESRSGFGSEDCVSIRVTGSDGLEGSIDVSWCMRGYRMPEFGLIIKGNKGNVTVDDDMVKLELSNRSQEWHRHDLNDNVGFLIGAPEYFREDNHFITSVLNRSRVEPSFLIASKVDDLLEQVKRGAVVIG